MFHHDKKEVKPDLITQNLRTRYFDERILKELLTELFGADNYRVGVCAFPPCRAPAAKIISQMKEDEWIIDVPRLVTNVSCSLPENATFSC